MPSSTDLWISCGGSSDSNLVLLLYVLDFPGGSEGIVSPCNVDDLGTTLGSGKSPGEENGNPLWYLRLEYPTDGEAW